MNNLLISKDNKINEISKKTEQNINEINSSYNVQIKNYEDTLKNMQTMKDKEIINMQKMIFDLKQENKKIFNLEKEINERNLNIFNLKEYIKNLEKQIFIHENCHDILFNRNKYNFNYSNANIPNNNINIKRDIHANNNINTINNNEKGVLNSYYNYLNSNLISFIIEQIKRVEMSIDNKNISFKNNILPCKLSEENSTNDLIRQNFELLINKINNLHQDNFNNKTELKNELEEEKNKNVLLSVNIKKSKNEIDTMKKILENKTAEIEQINNKLNQIYSSQNNNSSSNNNEGDKDISNNFEQQYNSIFSKLKNFSFFYCKDTNNNASSGLNQINLKLPNYSLDDNTLKKINDIFFTVKNLISFVEQNLKNNNFNNIDIKGNFDKYKNEINSLNLKIKKLSELFKKNENLLKQITDENKELKLRNEELENILNSLNKPNNSNASKTNNLNNIGNSNNNKNYYSSSSREMPQDKSKMELKDIINLNKIKNDNLINEFYNKNLQMNSLENEANKLIRDNYAGNNKNIVNKINNSININNNNNNINNNNDNNNNPNYTFKNENNEQNYENFEEEEIPDNMYNIYNNNMNNDEDYNEEEIYMDNNNEDNNNNDNVNEEENELYDNDNDYDNNNYNDYDNNCQNEECNCQSEQEIICCSNQQ